MLGYCLLRVLHGFQKRIVMKFMTVGHTKFGPDRIFGAIRQKMESFTALSLEEFKTLVQAAAECSEACIFDHSSDVRDFKSGTRKLFKNLPGFRANFYYSIVIERCTSTNNVVVRTATKPGEVTEATYNLQKSNTAYPALENEVYFPKVLAKKIGAARRQSLRSSIWQHIQDRFPDRCDSVDAWWSTYLSGLDEYAEAGAEISPAPAAVGETELPRDSPAFHSTSPRSGARAMSSALSINRGDVNEGAENDPKRMRLV